MKRNHVMQKDYSRIRQRQVFHAQQMPISKKNRYKRENQECAEIISPVYGRFHPKIFNESRKLALVLSIIMQNNTCVNIFLCNSIEQFLERRRPRFHLIRDCLETQSLTRKIGARRSSKKTIG